MKLTELEDAVINGSDFLVLESPTKNSTGIVDIVERKNELFIFRHNWDNDDGGLDRPKLVNLKGRANKVADNVWTIAGHRIRPANKSENDLVILINEYQNKGEARHEKAVAYLKP